MKRELRCGKPLEPEAALKAFKIVPGFRIELVAAEPQVVDPVDMAFDEDGRIWVAEMIDYPYGDAEKNPPQGRVRMLEDLDGDGRYEKVTVIADRLRWPTGLALWDGGAYVTAPPDVYYVKPDRRELVFSGFGTTNVQGLVNNPKWGLDNHIHCATSSSGAVAQSPKGGDALDLRGRDFRFRPGGPLDPETGGGLFGNCFDDFGRRFVCRNWYPIYHVVLEDRYLRRNPHLAVASGILYIAPNPDPVFRLSPPEAWRTLVTRMFLSGQLAGRVSVPTGRDTAYFTSASGTTIFRGTALGPECYGNAFAPEAATNLIHRKLVLPDGVTFRTERAEKDAEFLASPDNWFRPVNLANGPDGALYVCDMYREYIEHPGVIPEAVKRHLDMSSGKDRGRIWRITKEGAPRGERPRLGKATTAELVAALDRPDAWWRETAGRLLFQRQDKSALPALETLAAGSSRPASRAAALWALEGLGALADAAIERALGDPSADVREQAVRLSEGRKPSGALLARVDDPNARVRFQLALSLGEFDDPGADAALERLAGKDGADSWARAAILSSARKPASLLRAKAPELVREAAVIVGSRNGPAELAAALEAAGDSFVALQGLGEGLRRRGRSLGSVPGAEARIARAEELARDEKLDLARRAEALRLLAHGTPEQAERCLVPFLDARRPPELQAAAVRALASFNDPKVGSRFIEAWKGLTPAARPEALGWFRRPARYPALLEALEHGRLALSELPADLTRAMIGDKDHGERAKKLLGEGTAGDRRKVIAAYLPALDREGDLARGREVFRKNCTACHKVAGEGRDVGPELTALRERPAAELLVAILDPNREVNPQFMQYKARMKDGSILDGLIAAESAVSVTLKKAEGEPATILRSEIDVLASTNLSLMPEGLEKAIDVGQMADLLRFLKEAKP
jgi:putative membrane-bound dehydrogenase-like protein